MSESAAASSLGGGAPNHLASLVPTFDPSKDELQTYQQKLELVHGAWPKDRLTEFLTRVILNCQGTAFQKLQLHHEEIINLGGEKGLKRVVELLGGQWGKIPLERQYEDAERAIFQTVQHSDESNDSYLARADVFWSRFRARKMSMDDLQAYVLLRGSQLTPEEKKKVVLDSDSSLDGKLTIAKVGEAVRLLGASFFNEVTGQKKSARSKVYDAALHVDGHQEGDGPEDLAMVTQSTEVDEDDEQFLQQMVKAGDEDANIIVDFEQAAAEVLQEDAELAAAYNVYEEARRRLSEKQRHRGFWPPSGKGQQHPSKGKGGKRGKGSSWGTGGFKPRSRQSLQDRIMNSYCRICEQKGHWKAECPRRGLGSAQSTSTTSASAAMPTTVTVIEPTGSAQDPCLPLEFLTLPEATETSLDATWQGSQGETQNDRGEIVNHGRGLQQSFIEVSEFFSILVSLPRSECEGQGTLSERMSNHRSSKSAEVCFSEAETLSTSTRSVLKSKGQSENCFATHGTMGVSDSGASKTVIGSAHVANLIRSFPAELQKRLRRCPCNIVFRFGNQGTLESHHALVVPIGNLQLKIAIVEGSTPFLISNTLLRALEAQIDCKHHSLTSPWLSQSIPLKLTPRGLFLIDLIKLVEAGNCFVSGKKDAFESPSTGTQTFVASAKEESPVQVTGYSVRQMIQNIENSIERPPQTDSSMKKSRLSNDSNQIPEVSQPETQTPKISEKQLFFPSHEPPRPTSKAPDHGGDRERGFVPSDLSGSQGREDRLWGSPQGAHLSGSLERSGMGELHAVALQSKRQDESPEIPSLCGDHDRETRELARKGASDQGTGQLQHDSQSKCSEKQPDQASRAAASVKRSMLASRTSPTRCPFRFAGWRASGGLNLGGHRRGRVDTRPVEDSDYGLSRTLGCDQRASDRCPSDAATSPEHGASTRSSDPALGAECHGSLGRRDGDSARFPEWEPSTSLTADQKKLMLLISQISHEFEEVLEHQKSWGPRWDVGEVFCGPNSPLTQQVRQQQGRAFRFGYDQGDLSTPEGRKVLFSLIAKHRPKHLWYSPVCGPWSAWSQLNASRSVESWDQFCAQRQGLLYQIALGIVLYRHQLRGGDHFHWEQPLRSAMFHCPLLSEIHEHTQACQFDLCNVGDLKDPMSQKPIKKGLVVLTTSPKVYSSFHGRTCRHNHMHQTIEGTVETNQGRMNRSKFTETYPRKFARSLAKILCSPHGLKEWPFKWHRRMQAQILAASSSGEPRDKKPRLALQVPTKSALVTPVDESTTKRRRIEGKQHASCAELCQEIVHEINRKAPRVGKIEIHDSPIVQKLQKVFNDKTIMRVVACRGTDRTIGPPKDLLAMEAPFRRSLILHRGTGEIQFEKEWEKWNTLSNRQLVRRAHSCRLNITAFACNPKSDEPPDRPLPSNSVSTSDLQSHPDHRVSSPTVPSPKEEQVPEICAVQQGLRFRALSKDEQAMIIRMHKNLGHPSNEKFSQAMQVQGHRPEVIQAILELKCAVCAKSSQPKHQRPSTLKPSLDFNDKIMIDGISWTNHSGKTFHFYHILDVGSGYHVAVIAPNRVSASAIDILNTHWLNWAGAPTELFVDAGKELNSREFSQFVQERGIRCTTIAVEAHWQMGKIERHGGFLQTMLKKIDLEETVHSYEQLQKVLTQCTNAKNALSIRRGYAPEVIVFGKHARLPGSILSDESRPSHEALLQDEEEIAPSQFREMLRLRQLARKAFHEADNDSALRRAFNRRSTPHRNHYDPGEWIMIWRNSIRGGAWFGPTKVIIQEGQDVVWSTLNGQLYRTAPEHVRLAFEEENVQPQTNPEQTENEMSDSENPEQNQPQNLETEEPQASSRPDEHQHIETPDLGHHRNPTPESLLSDGDLSLPQPDQEPEANSREATPETSEEVEFEGEQTALISVDVDAQDSFAKGVWKCEITCELPQQDQSTYPNEEESWTLLATSAKKQRTEVRLSEISAEDREAFEKAKTTEVNNWLQTETVARVFRHEIPEESIMRCRWILTWKPIEGVSEKCGNAAPNCHTHKPKARLVVLGFTDPQIDQVPRDSPTLNKTSKMLLLQMIASKMWDVMSFDIKAAFLQGRPQADRIIGLEPPSELRKAMNLSEGEVCRLQKSAYGLVDAPFLWYSALRDELQKLGFAVCPFDPCLFVLREPQESSKVGQLSGLIGIHVDDGLCGGNEFFYKQLAKLEKIFPFGAQKSREFTFTGINLKQRSDFSIVLSQSDYVKKIPPIQIEMNRKTQEDLVVTENERFALRGLIGSLQYASVNTRPDISSKLSFLQSQINNATIGTLNAANKLLHEAKKHHDVEIIVKPIPLHEFCFMGFSDASFASPSKPDSHSGTIIVGTHQKILDNKQCPISPLSWGCKKIQRVMTSTLAAETTSLASSLDQMAWMRLFWAWLQEPGTDWKNASEALKKLPEAIQVPTLKDIAVTDCKSLFDLTTKTAIPSCAEFRVQLQARAIREALNEKISLRWVHSAAQLADALTKAMEASFLRETLKLGQYRLCDEESKLKERAKARDRVKWLKQGIFSEPQWKKCIEKIFTSVNFQSCEVSNDGSAVIHSALSSGHLAQGGHLR